MGVPTEVAFCPPSYLSVQLCGYLCQRTDQKQATSQQEGGFYTGERSKGPRALFGLQEVMHMSIRLWADTCFCIQGFLVENVNDSF